MIGVTASDTIVKRMQRGDVYEEQKKLYTIVQGWILVRETGQIQKSPDLKMVVIHQDVEIGVELVEN